MKLARDLYKEKELKTNQSLTNLSKITSSKFGLIKKIQRIQQYYDEPKFWYYSADVNDQFFKKHLGNRFYVKASGFSFFSEKIAILKCLSEAIERYCNFVFPKSETSFTRSIKQITGELVDPRSFSRFSESQLQKRSYKRFRITENSKFRWTECISLTDSKLVQIPSQFIYLAYPYLRKEPSIYPSISTGAAGGSCLSAALVRGIFEIVERDAFMIFYLNKLKAPRIKLENIKNKRIQKLLKVANRYKLKIMSFDITTDLNIPVIASVVVNRVGIGKAISVGLKSDFNLDSALIGSIGEAFHTRSWLRKEYEKSPKNINPSDLLKNSDMKTRGFLWYPTSAIKKLDFWLESPKTKTIQKKKKELSSGKQLKKLYTIFSKIGYKIYYKDITLQPFKKMNYYIVKVIIPRMQPLYLNEKYPLLGGERLLNVPEKIGYSQKAKEFNKYPHPFL